MTRPSRRASGMPPFLVMEVLERAAALEREGRSIIHMEIGEPDFDTPEPIRAAGVRAMAEGHTHYTHSQGHPQLREAISRWMDRRYGVEVTPGRIVVTMGTSGAMLLTCAALLDPGDHVLMTDPCYACYPNFVRAFHGESVRLRVHEADGFQYDIDEVARHLDGKTKALFLNSPSNPTGTVTSSDRMRRLAEATAGRVQVISDEIYHGLTYKEPARSILEFDPDAIVVSGFSKLYAMTGWRLGYAILPEPLVRPVQKLQQNLFISAPDFAQFAAIAALEEAHEDVERMRRCYDARRTLVLARLQSMGLPVLVEPTGAFYVFFNVARYTPDVLSFSFEVLEAAGVALTPGVDFGPGGEGFLRLSYANSLENLSEGLDRLEHFLQHR
ncbi:MAG: pyridoxal phosphate-dependent aminotransferase [Deltaproteobacteria bacterium]|nr:pyridoxal phosphate-dependent aminotransferase [Deltaproteobacteria bacterium]